MEVPNSKSGEATPSASRDLAHFFTHVRLAPGFVLCGISAKA